MGAGKLQSIISGYKNYKFPVPSMETLAKERAKICSECVNCKEKAILKVTLPDKRTQEIEGAQCTICKCPLSAKVRSLFEKCPLNKW